MKAKHFKKLRAKAKYYEVQDSTGLFGDFYGWGLNIPHIILAYDEHHACQRAHRKGIGLNHPISYGRTGDMHAHWKVKEQGKPDTHRFIKYF